LCIKLEIKKLHFTCYNVTSSNRAGVGRHDLCTLQLSPLYHREEGSEKRSRNVDFFNRAGVGRHDLCTLQLSPLYHREEGSEKEVETSIFCDGCVMWYVCSVLWSVWGAWRYALRQHTVKKEAETCVVVVRVEWSCRFGNPCCTPAYGGVEVHGTLAQGKKEAPEVKDRQGCRWQCMGYGLRSVPCSCSYRAAAS
jgi:hypothetical protein